MTILAFSFCDLQWWHVILAWLLPFVLGLLLGFAIWAKYKKEKESLEKKFKGLNDAIDGLKEQTEGLSHQKTVLDSEISSLKGRLRERDLQLSTLEASLAASEKKGSMEAEATQPVDGIKDDLRVIEGIGKEIERVLNEAGITLFVQLAQSSESNIKSILQSAGSQFNLVDTESWSQQAELANNGEWDALNELQEKLRGGRNA